METEKAKAGCFFWKHTECKAKTVYGEQESLFSFAMGVKRLWEVPNFGMSGHIY